MILPFFREKFEYDLYANLKLAAHIVEHEDAVDSYILNSFSHLVNVHHIWISRIWGTPPESHENDRLPVDYFERFCRDNFLRTNDYLEKESVDRKVAYHDSEGVALEKQDLDILYHILNHSTHHRAQVLRQFRLLDLPVPDLNFILYKD